MVSWDKGSGYPLDIFTLLAFDSGPNFDRCVLLSLVSRRRWIIESFFTISQRHYKRLLTSFYSRSGISAWMMRTIYKWLCTTFAGKNIPETESWMNRAHSVLTHAYACVTSPLLILEVVQWYRSMWHDTMRFITSDSYRMSHQLITQSDVVIYMYIYTWSLALFMGHSHTIIRNGYPIPLGSQTYFVASSRF